MAGQRRLRAAQLGLARRDLRLMGLGVVAVQGAYGETGVPDGRPAGGQGLFARAVGAAELVPDAVDQLVEPGAAVGQFAERRRSACCVADGRWAGR